MPGRKAWKWKYWVWNPTALPLWVLALLTALYALFTHMQWETQKAANDNSEKQFREGQDSTYSRFRADRDSTYKHFREALDTERSHFVTTQNGQLSQFKTLNEAHLVILAPSASDSDFQFKLRNVGKTLAFLIQVDCHYSSDPSGRKDSVTAHDTENVNMPADSPAALALTFRRATIVSLISDQWFIKVDAYYRDAFGTTLREEGTFCYDRTLRSTRMFSESSTNVSLMGSNSHK